MKTFCPFLWDFLCIQTPEALKIFILTGLTLRSSMHENCIPWLISKIVLNSNIIGEMSVFLLTYIKSFSPKIFHLRRPWMLCLQGVLYFNVRLLKGKRISWCKYYIDVIWYHWKWGKGKNAYVQTVQNLQWFYWSF